MSNVQFKEMSKSIEDLILTEEQISSGQYPTNEIYDIKFADEEVGPIWQQDIREYLQGSGHFEEGTEIKSYDSEEWIHIFEHPLFQRRKPQLVSTQVLDNEEISYHLLIDGQKHGPYTSFEVNSMIETKEILVTDEVSIDDGASWGHLYEIEDFDRRVLKSNEELPHLPKGEVFDQSTSIANAKVKNINDEKTNLIAGLAYIGNLRSGKAKEAMSKSFQNESEEGLEHIDEQEKTTQSYLWPILFAISAIGLITIFITWSNQTPTTDRSPASTKTRVKTKKIEPIKLKPIGTVNSPTQQDAPKIDNGSKVNSRPTSFRRSKAFRQAGKEKKKLSDDARYPEENDDFYYDDNTEPVELDPIRSSLSKETIDPEFNDDEFVDEFEGDIDAREPADTDEVYDQELDY